jgi:hypothetical protein
LAKTDGSTGPTGSQALTGRNRNSLVKRAESDIPSALSFGLWGVGLIANLAKIESLTLAPLAGYQTRLYSCSEAFTVLEIVCFDLTRLLFPAIATATRHRAFSTDHAICL